MTIDQNAIAKTRLDGLTPQAIRYVIATANALELGRVDEAERHIMGVMALSPNHPEVLRLLAGIQNLRGDRAGAIATMRRAVALRPNDALYHNTLGFVDAAKFERIRRGDHVADRLRRQAVEAGLGDCSLVDGHAVVPGIGNRN
jgi:Flp pilus assembly protein TadD